MENKEQNESRLLEIIEQLHRDKAALQKEIIDTEKEHNIKTTRIESDRSSLRIYIKELEIKLEKLNQENLILKKQIEEIKNLVEIIED